MPDFTAISRDELLNQLRALVSLKPSSPALKHLYERFIKGDAEQEATYEEHLVGNETAHLTADMLLLAYIDDAEITEAFKAVERWYS